MNRIFLIGVVLLSFAWCTSSTIANIGTLTGDERELWDHGGDFLIVARVVEIHELKDDPNETATHILKLEPLFTLAGEFDPSRQSQIQIRARIAKSGSNVQDTPTNGSLVLVLGELGSAGIAEGRPFIWAESSICRFMPDEAGMVVLHDLNDKRISETLARIRKVRDATTTTRPSDKTGEGETGKGAKD